jgi:hypothetical protein
MMEVIDTQALLLPEETFAGDPGAPDDLDPGAFVRIVARGFLVDDLDDALRTLQASLGWEPAAPVATVAGEGCRMARMSFALAQSAALELIEPIADGDVARFAEQWGPGPYHVRISVNDLEAKADDLRRRGTAFTEVREVEGLPGRRLRLDPLPGLATRFELVAHRDVPSAG